MTEEQQAVKPVNENQNDRAGYSDQHISSSRVRRNTLLGGSIVFVLLIIESVLWIFSPLFRHVQTSNTSTVNAIPVNAPLLLLVPLFSILAACLIVLLLDRPLGILAYLIDVQKDQQHSAIDYISLSIDPTVDEQEQSASLLELVQQQGANQFLEGAPGSGKTMLLQTYQYRIAQQGWRLLWKRGKIPVFIPLKNYSLALQQMETREARGEQAEYTLLDYLSTSNLVGMRHLRSYLRKLSEKGRLLFLCDGLNEVDSNYLDFVLIELTRSIRQTHNNYFITCRDGYYLKKPQLSEMINDTIDEQLVIYPLQEKQLRYFIEQYIVKHESNKQRHQHTAGQLMETIQRSRLRKFCTTPLLLMALLEIIDSIGIEGARQLDTRGRLLSAYVEQLILRELRQPRWAKDPPTSNEVLEFLSTVACAARWSNNHFALQLPDSKSETVGKTSTTTRMAQLADTLQVWLNEHPAQGAFAPGDHEGGHYEASTAQVLEFSQRAGLIDINSDSVFSFRHALIAEYLTAHYFFTNWNKTRPVRRELLANIAYWCEPVILWAELLNDPSELVQQFAASEQAYPDYSLEALMLSFISTSGIETSSGDTARHFVLPANVEKALTRALHTLDAPQNQPEAQASGASTIARNDSRAQASSAPTIPDQLAALFTRCAEEVGQEVYQSLLSLLSIDGIEEFLILLDTSVVPNLLFQYLVEIVDDMAREAEVKRLTRVLGHFGGVVVVHATELSQPAPQRSGRLRSAAINILGGTGEQSAVEPLLACLSDANTFIVDRAINALVRLGPELTLPGILRVLAHPDFAAAPQQTHLAALRILERFLIEPNPARQLTPVQYQITLEGLLPLLTSNYSPAAQQKAAEMLARQGHAAGGSEGGDKAVELLISNLAATDETMARNAMQTLKAIGPIATPHLLVQLRRRPPDVVRARIIEILGVVRDERSLPTLLYFMADPSRMVQQQLALALRAYTPESIPGLIELVLHSTNEDVASRAEQLLSDIGKPVVEPVTRALLPLVPGRTSLLVHVLEQMHDPQSLPALINLLRAAQSDQSLAIAVVHTLGQFPDQRVAQPLLEMLGSPHVLLYESAINALSHLGDVAVERLLAALDVAQKTATVQKVQRALLGMIDFPGRQMLLVLAHGTDAQVQHVREIFLLKGADAAPLLVAHLDDSNSHVRNNVRQIVEKMNGQLLVPALLEVLDHPEPSSRAFITELLLKHPREAIPLLVSLLGENERADSAESLLIQFGPAILPYIEPGLDAQSSEAQERAQQILVRLVRQRPEMMSRVVHLFSQSLSVRAHEALMNVLIYDLVDISIPALLEGLEDAYLIGDAAEALVRLIRKRDMRSEMVLDELLHALRVDERRHGAEIALIEIGEYAVHVVGNLITDPDKSVAQAAQKILSEIGAPAFSFIWAAHSDTSNRVRRDAARNVFRRMPTVVIKDELVELLTSNDPDNISMALSLLSERIHDEALQTHTEHEMIPALLEHVQTQLAGDERASQRIIALLLLLGGNDFIEHMMHVLYAYPNQHEHLISAFLLLGSEAEQVLLRMLKHPQTPPILRAEVAGVLGMRVEQEDVSEYASTLGEYGLWAARTTNRTGVLQPERLAVSLRALGGLLAGGHWDIARLHELLQSSKEGSPARELYEILLGWRYGPNITILENDLQAEREERERIARQFTQEILMKQAHIQELEHDLEQVRSEHDARVEELNLAAQERQSLRESLQDAMKEKQNIRDNHLRAAQDKQTLSDSLQQAIKERDTLQAQNDQWKRYCEQLEAELNRLRVN